ncbi:MAG: alpha/beta hydrolase [Alphaproteobacteria bacterium]
MDRRTAIGLGLAGTLVSHVAHAQTEPGYRPGDSREFVALWPAEPPGGEGIRLQLKVVEDVLPDGFHFRAVSQIQTPGYFVYRPARPTGLGLLVIPGGGYAVEGADRGGLEVAQYFASLGITCFVLRYRLPSEGWKNREIVALQDAQRAMRLIRAGEYGIQRLAVIGFSAGGHVSAALAIRHAMNTYNPVSSADQMAARPDIAAHMYPVITMGTGAHRGSRDKLLGENPSPEAVSEHSLELHVMPDASPSWVCLAADDDVVPALPNGMALFFAMQAAKVSSELHAFESGGHAFGVKGTPGKPNAAWPSLFLAWAASHNFKG